MNFDYAEMTSRNAGFLSPRQQDRLRAGRVFVCGTGGMGGACLQALVRAGVGKFEIADFDRFEVSNLNRQVFATRATIGEPKAEATARSLREINPEVTVVVHGAEWLLELEDILARVDVVVNGMDDAKAAIHLYRRARDLGVAIVDAYASTLPSVYTTRPGEPTPEERFSFPTRGVPLKNITPALAEACRLQEIEYVLSHSTTGSHVDATVLADIVAGRRPRSSFAPMVILTGNLMAYETIALLTEEARAVDFRGYFFNPYSATIELPDAGRTAGGPKQ